MADCSPVLSRMRTIELMASSVKSIIFLKALNEPGQWKHIYGFQFRHGFINVVVTSCVRVCGIEILSRLIMLMRVQYIHYTFHLVTSPFLIICIAFGIKDVLVEILPIFESCHGMVCKWGWDFLYFLFWWILVEYWRWRWWRTMNSQMKKNWWKRVQNVPFQWIRKRCI